MITILKETQKDAYCDTKPRTYIGRISFHSIRTSKGGFVTYTCSTASGNSASAISPRYLKMPRSTFAIAYPFMSTTKQSFASGFSLRAWATTAFTHQKQCWPCLRSVSVCQYRAVGQRTLRRGKHTVCVMIKNQYSKTLSYARSICCSAAFKPFAF